MSKSKNRYINTRIWDDDWFADLESDEKLLFIHFLTNPLTQISGAYQITLRRMVFDTGIDQVRIAEILKRFESAGKIIYKDNWLLLVNFIKHQSWENDKIAYGIENAMKDSPSWVRDRVSLTFEQLKSESESNPNPDLNPESTGKGKKKERGSARGAEQTRSVTVTELTLDRLDSFHPAEGSIDWFRQNVSVDPSKLTLELRDFLEHYNRKISNGPTIFCNLDDEWMKWIKERGNGRKKR